MIQVENLCKRYGSVLAVDGISFSVGNGEVVGILGPNGAGKTTTIRILTCFHPATSGTATIGGLDVFEDSIEVRRRIGYLPENTPLYPESRVREYLNFRGKLRGMTYPERRDAIKRVTDRCWLGEFVNRPIGQLSKGMRQRVGLADAIMHDPDVLILDEPTIGLDPNQIRETRNLIKELGERHTILLSSHILHEVEQTCSKTIIIAGGKVVASGSPQELRDRLGSQGRVVAEIKGNREEVVAGVGTLAGVESVDANAENGWVKLTVNPQQGNDVREDIVQLVHAKGWSLREIRREVGSLEDFFVKVTAEQASRRSS